MVVRRRQGIRRIDWPLEMGFLLQPRQNLCTGSFQHWTCEASSTQRQFSGCCLVDACHNGGICPPESQPPADDSDTSSTITSIRTITATRTMSSQTTTRSQVTSTPSTSTSATDPTPSTGMTTSGSATPTPKNTLAANQTSAPTDSTSSSGSNNPAIIGGVVAGVLVLVLLLIGCLLIRRKRQHKEHGEELPYGPVYNDKPSGDSPLLAPHFIYPANLCSLGILGLFSLGRNNENRNSMASTSTTTHHNFFSFKKRPAPLGPHPANRKETSIQLPQPRVGELPSPSHPPLRANVDFPYDHAELESEIVSAPSELSSTPLGGYRGSGVSSAWSPTPELPSDVSFSSTAAVLSPQRETHYSEASSSQTGSRMSGASQSGSQGIHDAPLRGGGWPTMRSNMHSLRRPVPNQNLHEVQGNLGAGGQTGQTGQTQGGRNSAPLPSPSPSPSPPTASRHVMSWMSYDAGDQSTLRPGGVVR